MVDRSEKCDVCSSPGTYVIHLGGCPRVGLPQPGDPTMNLLVAEQDTILGTLRSWWRAAHPGSRDGSDV